jgi:DNA-binding transcriptional LysR family regulator
MTLDQIDVLRKIMSEGSFRAASQKLNRAQSAVSYAVRSLEQELGFQLFTRDQYRPQLTAQGRAFLKQSEDLWGQFQELLSLTEFLRLGHEPQIRIGVSALWPFSKLAQALGDLKKAFPKTEIKIFQEVLSADQLLLDHQVDILLGTVFNESELLITQELFSVGMIPVCGPQFELARFRGAAKVDDLKKHTQIILRSTSNYKPRSAGIFNPANTISVDDFLSKKELLLSNLGWGFMPEHLIENELKKKRLVTTHGETMRIPMVIARDPLHSLGPCADFLWTHFAGKQATQKTNKIAAVFPKTKKK